MTASGSGRTMAAVLGTGLMGAGMARSLLRGGCEVRVWNRTADKAEPLAADGARVAPDPATAVAGADVVLTMLFDAESIETVMADVLPAMAPDAIWLQAATVGPAAAERFAELAGGSGVGFVDAPVLGTRQPAEQGQLLVLAAGPQRLRAPLAEVLDALTSRTLWVSERPGDGQRLKLVVNSWVLSITAATAQALSLARGLEIDPALFLETIAGGPTDSAYAQLKGKAMIAEEFSPSFALDGAVKDAELISAAMGSAGVDDALMTAVRGLFTRAEKSYPGKDMAAVVRAFGA
jgi:3-hydroxyisobutyrate dehydrogenase